MLEPSLLLPLDMARQSGAAKAANGLIRRDD
jgi:hypothetical protein